MIHITTQEFKTHFEPLDEPATSTITYTYGEGNEEMVLSFPTITFCDFHPNQFITDCNLTYEQVKSGFGISNAGPWTFQELLMTCLKSNISLDLDILMVKMKERLDSVFDLTLPTLAPTTTPTHRSTEEAQSSYLYKMQAIISEGQFSSMILITNSISNKLSIPIMDTVEFSIQNQRLMDQALSCAY